uniref:sugar ABC transporter substrate-binding protein n=1 Tax=Waltera acetigignens TaxID=2981769 RepID=UPI003F7CD879
MKMKKLLGMVMTVALCVSALAGCGSTAQQGDTQAAQTQSQAQSGDQQEAKGSIGILVVTTQSQWCNSVIDSVSKVVEAQGYDVMVSDSQASADNEISGMENLINAGCKAIVVNAMNPSGLADICKQAQDKGIYIIGWTDLLVNYDALVEEDTEAESAMIAEAIAEFAQDKGADGLEMATIWLADSANPDTTTGVFKTSLEKEFNSSLVDGLGMDIVNSQYASDTTQAMNLTEAILAANPNVKVIFCQSDEIGVAVAQTLESRGIDKDEIMVCGLDGSDEAINVIAGGNSALQATVLADINKVGENVGNAICTYLTGGTTGNVSVDYMLINRDNAADYKAN